MKNLFQTLCVCLLLLLSGCRPEGVLSRGEMADLLTDLYLTDGYIDAAGNGLRAWDSLDVYGPRLVAHGVALPDFEASVEYYLHHPRDFSRIYDDVLENLEKGADRLAKQMEEAEEAEESDLDEVKPDEKRSLKEKEESQDLEGTEPRIEKVEKKNSRKKLSKKELEELEKQLKQ